MDTSAPGLNTMHSTRGMQNPNVKYTPPPSEAFSSLAISGRLPRNGVGAAKPLPLLIATPTGLPLLVNTRSIRPSPFMSIRLASVTDEPTDADRPPARL